MSQTKSASSQGTDAKDKGTPAPSASSKATKSGDTAMGNYKVSLTENDLTAHGKWQNCGLSRRVFIYNTLKTIIKKSSFNLVL